MEKWSSSRQIDLIRLFSPCLTENLSRSNESPNSSLLNPSPPPPPPALARVSASAGRLIDGSNGLSVDTTACQSICAIVTWLGNSLPACAAQKPDTAAAGSNRQRDEETRCHKNGFHLNKSGMKTKTLIKSPAPLSGFSVCASLSYSRHGNECLMHRVVQAALQHWF